MNNIINKINEFLNEEKVPVKDAFESFSQNQEKGPSAHKIIQKWMKKDFPNNETSNKFVTDLNSLHADINNAVRPLTTIKKSAKELSPAQRTAFENLLVYLWQETFYPSQFVYYLLQEE